MKMQNLKKLFPLNDKTKEELKILNEKVIKKYSSLKHLENRRRLQVYSILDYYISPTTYFDFFTIDTLKVLVTAKILSFLLGKKIVTSDILLYSFFIQNLEIKTILKISGIKEKKIAYYLWTHWKKPITKKEKIKDFFYRIKRFFDLSKFKIFRNNQLKMKKLHKKIDYSSEIYKLFFEAIIIAKTRFNTPIISPEILLLVLIETKGSMSFKLFQKSIKNKKNRLNLRHKLIKKIYLSEKFIRYDLPPSILYFSYLFRSRLTERQFTKLLISNKLIYLYGVLLFRKKLIKQILSQNFLHSLKKKILYKLFPKKKERSTISYLFSPFKNTFIESVFKKILKIKDNKLKNISISYFINKIKKMIEKKNS